jgi:hypothetical protein
MFGRFQIPELLEPAAVASVLVTLLGYRLLSYRPVRDQASSEPSSSSPELPSAPS